MYFNSYLTLLEFKFTLFSLDNYGHLVGNHHANCRIIWKPNLCTYDTFITVTLHKLEYQDTTVEGANICSTIVWIQFLLIDSFFLIEYLFIFCMDSPFLDWIHLVN